MVSIIPQTFWQFSFAVVPGQVLISSLLKNSFGSSFRFVLRHGISLFVGFWRGGILYSVRDGVFRSLFQQPVSRVTGQVDSAPTYPEQQSDQRLQGLGVEAVAGVGEQLFRATTCHLPFVLRQVSTIIES